MYYAQGLYLVCSPRHGHASLHGFIRCSSFPREITDEVWYSLRRAILPLLRSTPMTMLAPASSAVGLGDYPDQLWTRFIRDERPENKEPCRNDSSTIKDVHSPGHWSILRCNRNDRDFTKVIIDVEQCPDSGGPREYAYTSLADELLPPWSLRRRGLHELELSGRSAWLDEYFSRRDCTNSNVAYSKICENSVSISRIEPTVQSSLAYPTVGVCCVMYRFNMTSSSGENMTLHQPKGHSLPKNKYFKLMLKRALSTHLNRR
ncbi:hypothetical protein EDD16DRAFT_191236 [Pisolithus croceorrhizus]|nr:hypothetical protein EDD16DRAFT_191236 [Pisolithus croceorrhizus]